MTIRVLIVDESNFFRRRLSEIVNTSPMMEVIDIARTPQEAYEKSHRLKPDIIAIDVDKPIVEGADKAKNLLSSIKYPTLVMSTLPEERVNQMLGGFNSKTVKFHRKRLSEMTTGRPEVADAIHQAIISLVSTQVDKAYLRTVRTQQKHLRRKKRHSQSYQITAIGASTGGPAALHEVLPNIPATYPHPILIIQHMPSPFTASFAKRLNERCHLEIKEAEDGEILRAGVVYIGKGGKQMVVKGSTSAPTVHLTDSDTKILYSPSLNITFESLAAIYKGNVLSVVLTGMGNDGLKGAICLKDQGSTIWAQDEDSCVVYGMPRAVYQSGVAIEEVPISDLARKLIEEVIPK